MYYRSYVVASTGLPIWFHHQRHGVINGTQVALAFFLGLNTIVCFWEMILFFEIALIARKHKVDQFFNASFIAAP